MTQSYLSPFKSKLPNSAISIFSRMSLLAQQQQAINLSQGFPDFDIDPKLISLVTHYMQKGFNQYAPMQGTIELRKVIADKYKQYYNLHVDQNEEITITAGGTEGLYSTIAALIHPGDEVITFEPAYDSYSPSVQSFGGKVVPIELLASDFAIDWNVVRSKITDRTKLIIINNPNNPTGRILSQQDILALEKIVEETGIYVLSDEVYEHLVFDGKKHISVLESDILRQKSFVVASFGKVLHATGWKLGYVVTNPMLTAEFRKIHQFNVFSVNTPIQFAIADYLSDISYYDSLAPLFQQKRDYLIEGIKSTPLQILPCEGTYFLLVDYSNITHSEELAYAEKLTQEKKVATIPISAFYTSGLNQNLLRICFAKKEETIRKALQNLQQM
ncbi:methionine aminotransferase [Sphingobacterium litopenaei]|uniref:Aminotransferase class I/II-fold pyridoxal phosphate-dependent enzyme n=1 Tax=Sphingobacterium litopenaei TaxID=2763500 RepID=A0ABR7YHP1_9SPHI|nr:methionine aminotransferase [Sphingobacterium litopenaei]MBD1430805.1 aminotransferase class I/II-fold pyridoxal phosphate-dependent enzyme [Sphingobacterium litopenaei]